MQSRYLIISGGCDKDKSEYFASVEKYDITNNTWTPAPSMHTPRRYHSTCCLAQYLYVFAGENSTGKLNSIEVISASAFVDNRDDTQWELIQIPTNSFTPRDMCLVSPLNATQIVILGGYSDSLC